MVIRLSHDGTERYTELLQTGEIGSGAMKVMVDGDVDTDIKKVAGEAQTAADWTLLFQNLDITLSALRDALAGSDPDTVGDLGQLVDQIGEVDAAPTANTLLARLNALETELGAIKSTDGIKKITDAVTVSGAVSVDALPVLSASDFEVLTVSDSVATLLDYYTDKQQAMITVEDAPIRYMIHPYYSSAYLADIELGVLNPDRVNSVDFVGNSFVKVAADPGANEWVNSTDLVDLIDALGGWTAFEPSAGDVVVTSEATGREWTEIFATMIADVVETSGGNDTDTPASCVLTSDMFGPALPGDSVEFYGSSFTRADANDAPNGEWADGIGLAACIDELMDWGATESGGDVTITAADNDSLKNGESVVVSFYRATEPLLPDEGHLADDGDSIVLASANDVANFRAVSTTGVSATIRATHYE